MSYHQLLKEAEARFLPDTDVDKIWGNLTTARQEATETVQDWWHRLKTLETDVLEFEEAEVSPDDFKVTKAKVERVAKGIFLKGLHCKDLYSTLQTAGDKPEDPSELLHWVLKHEKHRKELRKAKSRGTAPLVTKVRVVHDSISDSSSDDETPTASARVVRTGSATTTPATAPASAVGATAVPAGSSLEELLRALLDQGEKSQAAITKLANSVRYSGRGRGRGRGGGGSGGSAGGAGRGGTGSPAIAPGAGGGASGNL